MRGGSLEIPDSFGRLHCWRDHSCAVWRSDDALLYDALQTGTMSGGFAANTMRPFLLILIGVILLAVYVRRQKAKRGIQPFYATIQPPVL